MVSEASFFIYRSVLSHAMLLSEGLNEILMTQTRVRICVCQHNMNTPPRVLTGCENSKTTSNLAMISFLNEPQHISYNVVCATSKGTGQHAHTGSLIRAFDYCLNILRVLIY